VAKCVSKSDTTSECVHRLYGLRKESPTVTAKMLIENTLCIWIEFYYYVTPNMHIMEIQYAVPCEVCIIGEGHVAAKEAFFTLLKEPLEIFLAWAKIKQT
jgi:predicted AlkP superfamily pyrophosphatase or phosphodiesterase